MVRSWILRLALSVTLGLVVVSVGFATDHPNPDYVLRFPDPITGVSGEAVEVPVLLDSFGDEIVGWGVAVCEDATSYRSRT